MVAKWFYFLKSFWMSFRKEIYFIKLTAISKIGTLLVIIVFVLLMAFSWWYKKLLSTVSDDLKKIFKYLHSLNQGPLSSTADHGDRCFVGVIIIIEQLQVYFGGCYLKLILGHNELWTMIPYDCYLALDFAFLFWEKC